MATKRIKDLTNTAAESDIASGNYIALDGSAGTKKLNSTTLLTKTAQNALSSIRSLSGTANDFASDDYIAIDGATNGSRKMNKDSLLNVTAHNALIGINEHFVLTCSGGDSAGAKNFWYNIQKGLRYKIKNTSASGACVVSTYNTELQQVEAVATISNGASFTFTPSLDASYVHIYWNVANGSATIECLDGIFEKASLNETNVAVNKNALQQINQHKVFTFTKDSAGAADFLFCCQEGVNYKLTNTSASGSAIFTAYNSEKGTIESIGTLNAGSSLEYSPSQATSYIHIYWNVANGSATIESLDGICEKMAYVLNSGAVEKVVGNDVFSKISQNNHSNNVEVTDTTAKVNIVNQDTYFRLATKNNIVVSNRYTLSFDVSDFDGSNIAYKFYINGTGNEVVEIKGNGHYAITFDASRTYISFDDVDRTGATVGDSFVIKNIHLFVGSVDYAAGEIVFSQPRDLSSAKKMVLVGDGANQFWQSVDEIVENSEKWQTYNGNGLDGVRYTFAASPNTCYTLTFKNPSWTITGGLSTQNRFAISLVDSEGTGYNTMQHQMDVPVSSRNIFWTDSATVGIRLFIRADVGEAVDFIIQKDCPSFGVSTYEMLEAFRAMKLIDSNRKNTFVLGLFSDIHGFENMFKVVPELLDSDIDVEAPTDLRKLCNYVLELGDAVREYPNEEGAFEPYNTMYDKTYGVPILPICGNHEWGASYAIDWYQEPTKIIQNVFDPAVSKGYIPSTSTGDYIIDDSSNKFRLICLNGYMHGGVFREEGNWERVSYDSTKPFIEREHLYEQGDVVNLKGWTDYSYRAKISLTTPSQSVMNVIESDDFPCWESIPNFSYLTDSQKQWYVDALLDTPQDYGVFVAMHTPFSRNCTWDMSCKFSDKNFNQDRFPNSVMNGDMTDFVANATQAFVDGTAFSQDGISVDFANKNTGVKFMVFVGGHLHKDGVIYHNTHTNLKQILVTTSQKYSSSDISVYNGTPSITLIKVGANRDKIVLAKLGSRVSADGYIRDYEEIDVSVT